MKVNWQLFVGLSVFYVIMTIIYWYVGGEPVGIAGMLLSACLAGMVGFYLWFTQKRIGSVLPSEPALLVATSCGSQCYRHGFWTHHRMVAHTYCASIVGN